MRIGRITESGRPGVGGDAGLWRDRLVRGLGQHEFAVRPLDSGPYDDGVVHGRRARRRFTESYGELAAAPADASDAPAGVVADRFATALYGLGELAHDEGGPKRALRSEDAVRALARARRVPGALPFAREARVPEPLTVAAHLERALRPLSFMFRGRATVSTGVGAVVEVVGGTGLVVPPRNPRALAKACGVLLRDPERRARLGAAARARALELFSAEQNIKAIHGVYLEIVAHSPARRGARDGTGDPRPFAVPAEARLPDRRTGPSPSPVPPSPVPAPATTSPVPAPAVRFSAVPGSVISAPVVPAPVAALEALR